jgi:hypothetical protein
LVPRACQSILLPCRRVTAIKMSDPVRSFEIDVCQTGYQVPLSELHQRDRKGKIR